MAGSPGWRTASGDPVKNQEIWVGLDAAASDHEQVRWHWVKGTSITRSTSEPTCARSPRPTTPPGVAADRADCEI
jgi:hypothetical protein